FFDQGQRIDDKRSGFAFKNRAFISRRRKNKGSTGRRQLRTRPKNGGSQSAALARRCVCHSKRNRRHAPTDSKAVANRGQRSPGSGVRKSLFSPAGFQKCGSGFSKGAKIGSPVRRGLRSVGRVALDPRRFK